MDWSFANVLERHFFTALLTAVLLAICAGLSWWIWQERYNRFVPGEEDLVEMRGVAHSPQFRNRSSSVWFRFDAAWGSTAGQPAVTELRVVSPEAEAIEAALKDHPVEVTAWVVRSELGRGPREPPPSVLQLVAGDRVFLPLALGQELRVQQAGNARLGMWFAVFGIAVSLLALILHWVSKLRS